MPYHVLADIVSRLSRLNAVRLYGDSLPLAARLTDAMGQPLAGRQLSFKLDLLDATGVTDDLGIARVTLTPTGAPAYLPLAVTYAGNELTAPASTSATVVITRADTITRFEGAALLATGVAQQARARLLDADNLVPIAGRLLVFEADGIHVTATTDASGVATASLSWKTAGPIMLRVVFEGDAFYEPSSDRDHDHTLPAHGIHDLGR